MSAASGSSLQAELEHALARRVDGQVRFDTVTRVLYSTDASNHQVEPLGVVLPRHDEALQAVIEIAAEFRVPLIARGAGTGLAGQAIGSGLIVDTSRYLDRLVGFDLEARTVSVEPGAVLATVNQALAVHGFMIGPDPASGDRATLGGMIGTNASGAHSIQHGMTADHLLLAEAYLSDGSAVRLEGMPTSEAERLASSEGALGRIVQACLAVRRERGAEIAARWPRTWRRASGYGLNYLTGFAASAPPAWDEADRPYARLDWLNLAGLYAGSEGTLAILRKATLHIVPRPAATVLVVLPFEGVVDACDATPQVLRARPSSVELLPQSLLMRARTIPAYARKLGFVEGEPRALLVAEFDGATPAEARAAAARLGIAGRLLEEPEAQADLWAVRKAGLGLLMSQPGDSKPVEFIEDVAVPVERLGEYTRRVDDILRQNGTAGEWYAHASAGCLHMRPVLNLKSAAGVRAMDGIAQAVAELAVEMGGAVSGEHGDGMSRTRFNELQFGPELVTAFREIKAAFDPAARLNPGKIVAEAASPSPPDSLSTLRYGPAYQTADVDTVMAFRREGSFAQAVELCNGAGACLKAQGVMCPSYQATRDESASTRGRANILRAALAGRSLHHGLTSHEVHHVLDLCLECKGCKAECPSAVDMARLKAEFLNGWHALHGVPLRSQLFGNLAALSRAGTRVAPLVNAVAGWGLTRRVGETLLGIAHQRTFPRLTGRRFSQWFANHPPADGENVVVLFLDTYTETMVPEIGIAAVKVLEAVGCRVILAAGQGCCGRPLISKGMLPQARRFAARNLEALQEYAEAGVPILGLEPSCLLTLRDEYLEFFPSDPRAQAVADQALLIEEYLTRPAADGRRPIGRLRSRGESPAVTLHGHCHVKSLVGSGPTLDMLRQVAGSVEEIPSGCCGMAGSFGYEREHFELSQNVAELALLPAVRQAEAAGRVVAAAGMSCRGQIRDGTGVRARHPIEIVAGNLEE